MKQCARFCIDQATAQAHALMGPRMIEAVTGHVPVTDWEDHTGGGAAHVALGSWADVLVALPATANTPRVSPTAGEDSALLVRGTDTGAFLPERRPESDFDQAALNDSYSAVTRRQKRINQTVQNRNAGKGPDTLRDPS
ncbi:hypothetical protein [Streptomyces sp. NPDC001056]